MTYSVVAAIDDIEADEIAALKSVRIRTTDAGRRAIEG